MKILFLSHSFWPFIGGISTRAYNWASQLTLRGHEVTVWTPALPNCPGSEIHNGIRIRRFKVLHVPGIRRPTRITPHALRLCMHHEGGEFDVVHGHALASFQVLVAAVLCQLRRKPFVLSPVFTRAYDLYKATAGRRILQLADLVLAQCQDERRSLLQHVPDRKLKILYNGVDRFFFQNLPGRQAFRHRFGLDDKAKIILYVGSARDSKRVNTLVESMPRVAKTIPNAQLVLVGTQPGAEEIQGLARVLRVDRHLLCLPKIRRDLLKEAYAAADVFAFPSAAEVFGNVLLEAAACGTPIVTTKVGIAEEIVEDGVTGILFEPNRIRGFADALIEVLTRDRYSEESARRRPLILERFDVRDAVVELEALYLGLVN